MYGYVYLTTNNVNGKQYIGQKKSDVFLENKYLGSGKILKQAIKKDGKENFTVQLLEACDTKEELNDKEIYWILYYDAVNSENFYNLATGGNFGFNGSMLSEESRRKIGAKNSIHRINYNKTRNYRHSEETKQKISNTCKSKRDIFAKSIKGKVHIKNVKLNKCLFVYPEDVPKYLEQGYELGVLNNGAGHNKGEIGKRKWINNGTKDKQVLCEKVDEYLSNGWVLGRLHY